MFTPGTVVSSRFTIEEEVGRGGMGVVYRAKDAERSDHVAVKLLDTPDADDARRFALESELVARLSHPAIVEYRAHGVTDEGELFLAMEWLEGEDLMARLKREPLSAAETFAMVARLADALALAHGQGIVHRDVKPPNVFLPGGDPRQAKLLDFGIAFRSTRSTRMTAEGVLVGTPGYLAPEQVRSEAVDARADVFSLGCLLYECVSHRRAFPGEDVMAILGRVLLDPVLLLSDVMAEAVPEELERLVDRMLSKDRKDRPQTMAEVSDVLTSIDPSAAMPSAPRPRASFITGAEQRLLAVVAVAAPKDGERHGPWVDIARAHGVRLEVLPDGAALGSVSEGSATDIATRAARVALALDAREDVERTAVVVGRGVVGHALPMGIAIDRAVSMLKRGEGDGIRVGDDAAALLGQVFEVEAGAGARLLVRERDLAIGGRMVLGRPAPFVGRDAEVQSLEAAFEEVVRTGRAAVHAIVGDAGIGKSRLVTEILARLLERGPARLLVLHGDPLRARAPFAAIAPAIRATVGVRGGDGLEVARARVLASLVRALGAELGPRHAPFLAELAGVPFQDVSAGGDLRVVGDRMREAFAAWVTGLARTQPVIIVAEDVPALDAASRTLLDDALGMLVDRSVFVLTTARVPSTALARHAPIAHTLAPLAVPAARAFVEALSSEVVAGIDVERVVDAGAGHPFHLEELVRAAAAGEEELPDTVLAGVETRLGRLRDEERRILRAASVFGDHFSVGGAGALLPEEVRDTVPGILEALEALDLVTRPADDRLAFAQRVIRDAAYATLTAEDRARGHRRAAEWLEANGEPEPGVLADHWARGGRSARAAALYLDAARLALEADDLDSALELCESGFGHADGPSLRGAIRRVAAEAHLWRGEARAARGAALSARAMSDPSDPHYAGATAVMADASLVLGASGTIDALVRELGRVTARGPAWADALARVAMVAAMSGRVDGAAELVERLRSHPDASKLLPGRVTQARAALAGARGDVGTAVELRLEAAIAFEAAGAERLATIEWMNTAGRLVELGAYERACALLEDACASSKRVGLRYNYAFGLYTLGVACSQSGALDEARRALDEALALHRQSSDRRLTAATLYELALVALRAGDTALALEHASSASALLEELPGDLAPSLAVVALVHAARGEAEEARAESGRAFALMREHDVDDRRALIYLAHARSLEAGGGTDEARAVLEEGIAELRRQAARVENDDLRRSFWERVPEHRALAALAEAQGLTVRSEPS